MTEGVEEASCRQRSAPLPAAPVIPDVELPHLSMYLVLGMKWGLDGAMVDVSYETRGYLYRGIYLQYTGRVCPSKLRRRTRPSFILFLCLIFLHRRITIRIPESTVEGL